MRPDTAAIKEHIPLNWSFLDYIEASAVKRRTLGPKTKEYSKIHRQHFRPCPRMNRHFKASHHKIYCRIELKVGRKRSGGLGARMTVGFAKRLASGRKNHALRFAAGVFAKGCGGFPFRVGGCPMHLQSQNALGRNRQNSSQNIMGLIKILEI